MFFFRFLSLPSVALALAFVFTPGTATAEGETSVHGCFGVTLPCNLSASGLDGSFFGSVESSDGPFFIRTSAIENSDDPFGARFLERAGPPKIDERILSKVSRFPVRSLILIFKMSEATACIEATRGSAGKESVLQVLSSGQRLVVASRLGLIGLGQAVRS